MPSIFLSSTIRAPFVWFCHPCFCGGDPKQFLWLSHPLRKWATTTRSKIFQGPQTWLRRHSCQSILWLWDLVYSLQLQRDRYLELRTADSRYFTILNPQYCANTWQYSASPIASAMACQSFDNFLGSFCFDSADLERIAILSPLSWTRLGEERALCLILWSKWSARLAPASGWAARWQRRLARASAATPNCRCWQRDCKTSSHSWRPATTSKKSIDDQSGPVADSSPFAIAQTEGRIDSNQNYRPFRSTDRDCATSS